MTTESRVELRPMLKRDLKRVLSLENSIFSDPWPKDAFDDHMHDLGAGALVAEVGGRIAAYACYQLEHHELHLTNLAVNRAHRRKSVAKQILTHILELARDRGCELIFLEVRVSNEAARCFYEAAGFRTVKRMVSYYENPVEDALIMMQWIGVAPSNR